VKVQPNRCAVHLSKALYEDEFAPSPVVSQEAIPNDAAIAVTEARSERDQGRRHVNVGAETLQDGFGVARGIVATGWCGAKLAKFFRKLSPARMLRRHDFPIDEVGHGFAFQS
jgi:hypothetical protein